MAGFFNIVRFNDNSATYMQHCEHKRNYSKQHLYLLIYFFLIALVSDFDWLLKTIL